MKLMMLIIFSSIEELIECFRRKIANKFSKLIKSSTGVNSVGTAVQVLLLSDSKHFDRMGRHDPVKYTRLLNVVTA